MKVIFLDIDGVLNSFEYRRRLGMQYYAQIIDRKKMPLLKAIVDATGAKIVLSTSWRKYWKEAGPQLDSVGEQIESIFAEYGLSVHSKIPVLENAGRNAEITAWLDKMRYIDGYVILDDKDFGWSEGLSMHFVQTDQNGDGLEDVQLQDIVGILNGNLHPAMKINKSNKKGISAWLNKYLKTF